MQKRSFFPKVTNLNETNFKPGINNIDFETVRNYAKDINIKGDELNAFIEDDIDLGDGVRVNGGINYSMIFADKNSRYSSLQPRFALLANSDNLHFKIGVTRMQQYLHLLTNNGLGLPTDVWLPTNSNLPPQKSWIFNTSFGYKLNNGFKFGTEVYYKKFDDISSFKEGGGLDISEGIDWQSSIPIGNGYAYGFETFVEKVLGNTLFSVNYTYSISDRTYADLNNGLKFPFSLNRSHSFKVSFTHRLSQFSEFLLNWSYSTGNYYSKPENITIDNSGRPTVVYFSKNNALFPAFHRLDIGFGFYNSFKWGKAKFFLGLYNAYNRNNPFYTELVKNNQNQALYEFRQYSLLPILPTISYSVSF
ncbi:MAG: TonB-dependent receptor [Saprospiraceae bacterium]|nr:TonB-dependent receptor [Saprospiraceae bacterium]